MARGYGIGSGSRTGGLGSGGTAYNPRQKKPKPPVSEVDYITPPVLSYDPAIEAQRRAVERGVEDTEADVKTKEHFGATDLAQALKDIRTSTSRKRGSINRDAFRGFRTFDSQEADVQTKGKRANQDFDTQLANIGRQFAQLGHRQGEAANAAGVYDAGTINAGGAARAGNQKLAEAPIGVARTRTNEDLATALGRIATGRSDLGEDQTRSLTHLTQDRDRDRTLSHRQRNREEFKNQRELERTRREGQFSNIDLITQEIYAARAEHPGVYRQWKKEHPEATAAAEGRATASKKTGGNVEQGIGAGMPAPQNKKKKGRR